MIAVSSSEAVTANFASGEKSTDRTASVWPSKDSVHSPESAFHIWAMLVSEAVITVSPTEEKTACETGDPIKAATLSS